ncbi:hypothetical protein KY339_03150 [Candidatus Woesearchaeota archaeon]|nr:hypothetical protein [Candidatus Woesearchaeota archaeon]
MPEVKGRTFRQMMGSAVTKILKNAPFSEKFGSLNEDSVGVYIILRGGLNFNLMESVGEAFPSQNTYPISVFTSQRYQLQDGTWHIGDDQYCKIVLPYGSSINMYIGDIIATGSTLDNALARLYLKTLSKEFKEALAKGLYIDVSDSSSTENALTRTIVDKNFSLKKFLEKIRSAKEAGEVKKPIQNIMMVTIGCGKTEEILAKYNRIFKETYGSEFENVYALYIEGKFGLAEKDSPLKVKIPGTDLLRSPALLAPEFVLAMFSNPYHFLEACAIYDGGARSFNIPKHKKDVIEYWEKTLKNAEQGFTVKDFLEERMPRLISSSNLDYEQFAGFCNVMWHGVDENLVKDLFEQYSKFWNSELVKNAEEKDSLVKLCKERIEQINNW